MLNSVLSQTKKVGARDRVRMLPVADLICSLDDHRPRPRSRPSDDGFCRVVTRNNLELGPVATVQN